MLQFPEGFLWGVATSAHQFEGQGSSNQWKQWEQLGHVRQGYRCGDACDWWRSAESDLDLCRELGLSAIRVSIDWGRVEPFEGGWDHLAVARYRALLESIRFRGMKPIVTLHHFTHPQWFEERGGFLARGAAERFATYAKRIVRELTDHCDTWITFNEPNVLAAFGYIFGEFPPGFRNHATEFAKAMVSMHRAHAIAYSDIHDQQPNATVGIAHNWVEFQPATEAASDRLLAHFYAGGFNRSSLQLLLNGSLEFPLNTVAAEIPEVVGKIDFFGLNVYNRLHVRAPFNEVAIRTGGLFVPTEVPQGDRGAELPYGEAYPAAITAAVAEYSRLGVPLYITENGVPDRSDRIRPWVMVQSLARVHECIASGHNVRGYFHWSIVDNFEWSEGWELRFGLYELDLQTKRRTARPSAAIYREIITANSLSDELLGRFSDPPVTSPPLSAGTS
jgi:beta-glucosidase